MNQSGSASKMSASVSKMSASRGSRGKHSEDKLKESIGKSSSKKSIPPQQPLVEDPEEDENSLERDEAEDYSNEFISESIPSGSISEKTNMKSASALQQKASEIEESGYSDNFEVGASIGQSANVKKDLVQSHKSEIEEVLEEEDINNESSNAARSPTGDQEASEERSAPSPPLDHY